MEKYIIPNLKNACIVLKHLSKQGHGVTIKDVTNELSIPRTTVLRILTTLKSEGMVYESNGSYTLGVALIGLGLNAMNQLDLQALARPVLAELSKTTQETSHLAILSGHNTLIQDVFDSPHPVRAASRPGAIAPLYCSSTGKLFLAHLLSEQIDEIYKDLPIIPLTANTARTVAQIKENVKNTLETGYGLDDEEYSLGVRCLAAPITNIHGEVVAAIGITASITTFTKKKLPTVAKQVKAAALEISKRLGATENVKA